MSVPSLRTPVLDHGFVALRNLAGPTRRPDAMFDADDSDPADAARMSFDAMSAERTAEQDRGLCDYLMRNWHTSPFEMIECWMEMKMPIFVARQFVRHRTASLNEVSARYITLPEEWYTPEVVMAKPENAKQGSVDTLPLHMQHAFKVDLGQDCRRGYELYTFWIDQGAAPEQARCFLHVNHYTHWLWKQDLHNMMHLLQLRDHHHAQNEATAYAVAIDGHLRTYLPGTMELYDKYRRQNARVLRSEFDRLVEALRWAQGMCESALPQFNWSASNLDCDAIQSLNETPIKIADALKRAEKV